MKNERQQRRQVRSIEAGFRTREAVDIRGENYHKSVFTLLPFSQVTRRHRVTLHQRGHYALQMASVTAGDLLGMRSVGVDMESFERPDDVRMDALRAVFSDINDRG